ncbi:hypothetical protein FWH58_00500 [Candidatus Saccharibacteria bacterium]|nr:hypothetical protein [Candidatus Saccharibacteria bacterium]
MKTLKSKWGLWLIAAALAPIAFPMSASAATAITSASATIPEPIGQQKFADMTSSSVGNSTQYQFASISWFACTNSSYSSCDKATYLSSADTAVGGKYYISQVVLVAKSGYEIHNINQANVTINGSPVTSFSSAASTLSSITITSKVFQAKQVYSFTLTPSKNYTFPAKTVGYSSADSYSVTISNKTKAAYSLMITLSGPQAFNFTTSPTSVSLTATGPNSTQAFKVTPKTGLAAGTYSATVTVQGTNAPAKSFNVSFKVNPAAAPTIYSITIQNDGHGTGSSSPTATATGTAVDLIATPESGYKFKSWQVVSGGVTVTNNKFIMGTANVVIKALFEPLPSGHYAVNVSGGVGGTAYADVTSAASGTTVKLFVEENAGYIFKKWDVISGPVELFGDEFTMPNNAVTLKALFEPIPGYVAETDDVDNPDGEDITEPGEDALPPTILKAGSLNWLWILFGGLVVVAIGSGITLLIIRKQEKAPSQDNVKNEDNKKGGEE